MADERELENNIVDILTAERGQIEWLVPGLFLQGNMLCYAGEPGTGKSMTMYSIGLAIAAGLPLFGNLMPASEPKRVVYFDQENSQQDRDEYLRRAFTGLCTQYGVKPHHLHEKLMDNFWPRHFELGCDNWKDVASYVVDQVRPHLIVVDTATPTFDIEDENDNAEASRAINDLRGVMRITTPVASSLVMRHAKMRSEKGGRRTMRGAKVWHSATDGVLFQVKAAGRPRKDGLSLTRIEPDKVRAFGLKQSIYITPEWTGRKEEGLMLQGSYSANRDHARAEKEEDADIAD